MGVGRDGEAKHKKRENQVKGSGERIRGRGQLDGTERPTFKMTYPIPVMYRKKKRRAREPPQNSGTHKNPLLF